MVVDVNLRRSHALSVFKRSRGFFEFCYDVLDQFAGLSGIHLLMAFAFDKERDCNVAFNIINEVHNVS
ncbi:hypothetical protein BH24ACI3_BH24ACI3_06390 [soil metagenome]